MKKTITGTIITWTFNGEVAPLSFDSNSMSVANQAYAITFGMGHRLGDMAAIPKKDGLVITEQMRRDEIKKGIEHYENAEQKEWNLKFGPQTVVTIDPFMQEFATKRGVSYAEAQILFQKMCLNEV